MLDSNTLYVSDLDGTLLNRQDRISERSLSILNGLIGRGMHFTYATARSLVSARQVAQGLNMDIPVIVYNGTYIMNAASGEILYSCGFTAEERSFVQQVMEQQGILPLVYSFLDGVEKVSWVTSGENDGIRRYLRKRKGDPRLRPLAESSTLYDGESFYYTCIGEKEELEPVYHIFKEDSRFTCTLQQELYRPEYWCEILPRQATKAQAICHLKELLQCDRVVAFGDAINDIPMFRQADEAYAVENAVPELKELATDIIAGNEEDGVALWLQEQLQG